MKFRIRKDLWKFFLVILAITGLVAAPPAPAANEVNPTLYSGPSVNTQSKWTNNIEVGWDAPTPGSGQTLLNYIYLWNNVSTAMNDTDFNSNTTGVSVAAKDGADARKAVKAGSDLTAKDYSLNPTTDVLYVHVKTVYEGTSPVMYSTDARLGPFQVDNIAPQDGSIRIVDGSGNTIASTSSTNLNVRLAASGSIGKYYISETEASSGTGYSPFATDVAWGLGDTAIGSHTLYAWFEDPAGNKSTRPATASVTLLGAVSITPYTATIDLSSPTQKFQIDGSAATDYTWSITDPKPETTGQTVAEITGSATGNSVTVTAKNKGTFTVTATPASGTALKSGTITVVQSIAKGDVNNDGAVDAGDAILVLRYSVGLITLTDAQKAAGNVTSKPSNNDIDSGDAIKILRYSVGLITSL